MSYLDLINNFWQKDIEYGFSEKEIALYFYLLNVCNSIGWKNPFGLSNSLTVIKFGWGKQAFNTAKQSLKTAGLIDFKCSQGRGKVYQYELKGSIPDPFYRPFSNTFSDTFSGPKAETSLDIDIDKSKKNKKYKRKLNNRFTVPEIDQIADYCTRRNNGIDAQQFFDFYQSKGWILGKTQMRDWHAAIRVWERSNELYKQKHGQKGSKSDETDDKSTDRKKQILRFAANAIAESDS